MKNNILITGAVGFLGSHFCELLALNGFNVIGLDKNKKQVKKFNEKLKKSKISNINFLAIDISKEKEVKKLKKKLDKQKIIINCLINNAAIDPAPKKNLKSTINYPSIEQWHKEIDVSLIGSFLMIKHFSKNMIMKKSGKIVFIGSDLSVILPNPKFYDGIFKNYVKSVTYPVIKHSLVGLMRYYSVLFAKYGINVNMLSPSPIFNNQEYKFLKRIKSVIPKENILYKRDLDSSLLYLLDNNNNFLTGQNIIVDGGRTIV